MNMNEITRSGKDYIGYDYTAVTAPTDKISVYLDAYGNLGWIQDNLLPSRQVGGLVTLKLKRDRKILNKAELTRLQQHFEACMDEIAIFENSRIQKASMLSITVGLVGTVFMAGSVFAVTAEPPKILLCALLAIPAIIGWALPYRLFKFFVKKRAAEVMPLIERKYDEIHEICEKGNALIH